MPKRTKHGRGGKGGGLLGSRITRTPFRVIYSQSKATDGLVIFQLDLSLANLGTRATDIGLEFQYFRIPRMRVSSVTNPVIPGSSVGAAGAGLVHMIAADNSASAYTATPTTLAELCQFRHFALGNSRERLHFDLSKDDLYGGSPLKWFHCDSTGSPDAMEKSVGSVYFAMEVDVTSVTLDATLKQYVVLEGEVEFHTPVDFTISRERMQQRLLEENPDLRRAYERVVPSSKPAVPTSTPKVSDPRR